MVGELGFKRSALDHSVFCRKHNEEHTIVSVATDDMALTSKRKSDIVKLKHQENLKKNLNWLNFDLACLLLK